MAMKFSMIICLILAVFVMVLSMPTDEDPTDPDVGSNQSPLDPSSFLIKKKIKKLLLG